MKNTYGQAKRAGTTSIFVAYRLNTSKAVGK
jgi:hypothetical protein